MSRTPGQRWWLPVALAGLSCAVPRTHYYTIEMPHVTQQRGAPAARHITVHRFHADHVLVDDRILYREGPNRVGFYEYSRWASPPVDIVTNYFIHRLKESGNYARVSSHKEAGLSELALQGRLHHFEEMDRGKEVSAFVALELELTDTRTRALLWRGATECSRPITTRDMSGIVSGIAECLNEAASKLLTSMHQDTKEVH